MLKIMEAVSAMNIQEVRQLFKEYIASLESKQDNQHFDTELANFPTEFSSPTCRLLLASFEELPGQIGCNALNKLDSRICEVKNLYVKPPFRGMGIGRTLCERLIEIAISIDYRRIRLNILPPMTEAIMLFRTLGFQKIEAYCNTPIEQTLFMELVLV